MGNLSTFGTFTMARLGIYVSQQALTVTGNNISNINTKGYTRQEIDQSNLTFGGADRYQGRFDTRLSGGVIANGVNQLRDPYLDIRYRNEMTTVGELDAKLDGLNQLSSIIDEVRKGEDGEGVLEARFNELIEAMELHATQGAGKDYIDTIVRSSASELAKTFNDYANRLETLAKNEEDSFDQNVTQVNTILERIRDLNSAIRKTQVFGGEALTQQDERNVLIDQLSEYVGINVTYDYEDLGEGIEVERLRITTSGSPEHDLIYGIYGSQLSVAQVYKDDVYNADGTAVHKAGDPVAAEDLKDAVANGLTKDGPNYDITISELKTAKGKVLVNSDGTTSETVAIKDTELTGSLQAQRELLTECGEYSDKDDPSKAGDVDYDPDAKTKRGIPYYQKALDTLASKFAAVMNEANAHGDPNSDDISLRGGVLFSNSGNSDDPEGITAKNISVSQSWKQGDVRVLRSTKEDAASRDQDNLRHIVTLLNGDQEFELGKDGHFTGTFQEMFTNNISGTLADDKAVTQTMLSNHETAADELYVDRDGVMGVDLNDEAMNMMQFQKAYSAACRLMTTYDGMLDKLINGTAI